MKIKLTYIFVIIFTLSLICSFANCSDKEKDEAENKEIVNNSETVKLAEVINEYRASKGLSKIPISPSLTKVAQLHVKDLAENHPNQGVCNLHSWSDKGNWSACCYTSDHKNAKGMWNKPKELTSYKGYGYEIAASSSAELTAELALSIWKTSRGHHNVILNKGMWKKEWKAMGAAIYKGYAVVWFGHEKDTE